MSEKVLMTENSAAGVLIAHRPSALRKVLVGLAGAGLACLVVMHSLVAYLAESYPDLALRWSPHHPVAIANSVQQRLATPSEQAPVFDAAAKKRGEAVNTAAPAQTGARSSARTEDNGILADLTPQDAAELRARVERALAVNPLSAPAIRMLGQLADVEGDREKASRLLEIAARRSKHEIVAVYLMMHRSIAAGNWDAAMYYADLVIRSRPELRFAITPTMAKMAETPGANEVLKRVLANDPEWRKFALIDMLRHVTNSGTPLDLLVHLKSTKRPPSEDEIRDYLHLLVQANLLPAAYYARLQLMTPEQLASAGFVINGDFQQPTSNMPFDWALHPSIGATTEITRVAGDTDNRALRIEFGSARVQLNEIQQRLMLPPGTYRLSAKYRGEILARRGMKIIVSCASAPARDAMGETPMFIGNQATWRTVEFVFKVGEECMSQMLRIRHDARFAAEQFASGVVWYDDIHIRRHEGLTPEAEPRSGGNPRAGQ